MIIGKKSGIVLLLFTFILALSVCFADAIDPRLVRPTTGSRVIRPSGTVSSTTKLTKVEFEIPKLTNGGAQIKAEDITVTEGAAITNMSWTNVTGKAFMTANETYRNNDKYSVRIYFWALNGFELDENIEVLVNGDKVTATPLSDGSGKYLFDKEFEVKENATITQPATTQTISKVEIKIPTPTAGNTQVVEKDVTISKGAKVSGFSWIDNSSNTFMLDDEKYEEGKKYTLRFFFNSDEGYTFEEGLKATLNGEEIKLDVVKSPNQYKFEKEFEIKKEAATVTEKPKVSEEPKISEAPKTTAAPKVTEKPEEVYYTITFETNGGNKIASQKVKENELAKMPEVPKKEGYIFEAWYWNKALTKEFDFTEPVDDDYDLYAKWVEEKKQEVQKVVWSKVSNWAIDEVTKANDAGLIPKIFDKEDLTKDITRKEFAHLAVILYEKLAGIEVKIASIPKNPFTDTDDVQVLWAYEYGITNGTSDTTFEPNSKITREQMATMMTRALLKAKIDVSVDLNKVKKFNDDDKMHSWGKDSIYFMSEAGIIKGMGDNQYGVEGTASREQAILISVRSAEKFSR